MNHIAYLAVFVRIVQFHVIRCRERLDQKEVNKHHDNRNLQALSTASLGHKQRVACGCRVDHTPSVSDDVKHKYIRVVAVPCRVDCAGPAFEPRRWRVLGVGADLMCLSQCGCVSYSQR